MQKEKTINFTFHAEQFERGDATGDLFCKIRIPKLKPNPLDANTIRAKKHTESHKGRKLTSLILLEYKLHGEVF